MTVHSSDYYVVIYRIGERGERWNWELRRKGNLLGVKMTGDGYEFRSAAKFAGKRALADFLSDLSNEEKRPSK
jgi:hypothetical protein